jgi:hypothetical protein
MAGISDVLNREPVQPHFKLDGPEDLARLQRELKAEGEEIATILGCLEKLKGNRDYAELRLATLIECWWRSYRNLWLAMDATMGPDKDELFEMLRERRAAWWMIQLRAEEAKQEVEQSRGQLIQLRKRSRERSDG